MSAHFREKCDQCGFLSEPYPESYLAFELDKPTGLQSTPCHPDNECDIIIPKPGGKLCLEAHGLTMRSATKEGRMIKYSRMYCRECGEAFEYRTYYINGLRYLGCFWPILGSLIVGVTTGYFTQNWTTGVLTFLITLGAGTTILGLVMDIVLSKSLAEKFSKNKDLPRCPHCASIETTKHRLKCHECGLRTAKVIAADKP